MERGEHGLYHFNIITKMILCPYSCVILKFNDPLMFNQTNSRLYKSIDNIPACPCILFIVKPSMWSGIQTSFPSVSRAHIHRWDRYTTLPAPRGRLFTPLKLTVNSSNEIDLSVYMTSFSAVKGLVSFNLDAKNMHTAPNSWSLVLGMSTTERNRSM